MTRRALRGATAGALAGALLFTADCASPGLPKAPSLQLPALVTDLQATRRGDEVELQFAVPTQTTEGLPYRSGTMRASVCRAVESGACVRVATLANILLSASAAGPRATMQDALPANLLAGPARLLTYRVELTNARGRTAGFGEAAYSAVGAGPAGVSGLRVEGSRQGVVVRWHPGDDGSPNGTEVVLRRELVSGAGKVQGKEAGQDRLAGGKPGPAGTPEKKSKRGARRPMGVGSAKPAGSRGEQEAPGIVWLSTAPETDPLQSEGPARLPVPRANGVLDDSAATDSTYRYSAERQHIVQLGGHLVTMESVLSAPVEVTLRAVYPPPAPTDLAGTAFPLSPATGEANAGQPGNTAVDLIWTPADDEKTVGYNVYREVWNESGAAWGERVKLTASPGRMPAFHEVLPADVAKSGARRLRYSVTAVDAARMESAPVTAVVEIGGR